MKMQTRIEADDAYHADFTAWLLEQAARLRARDADALDWDNLAEEIESLGLNHYRELGSRLRVIILHMIKLQLSYDERPRAGWRITIRTQRVEIDDLLQQSPSLRRRVDGSAAKQFDKARSLALDDLAAHEPGRIGDYRRIAKALAPAPPENLLDDDWFPEPPAPEADGPV